MKKQFTITFRGIRYDAFLCSEFFIRERYNQSPCSHCHFPKKELRGGRLECEGAKWCCADLNGKKISVFFRRCLEN